MNTTRTARHRSRRRSLVAIAFAASLMLVLTACSSDDDSPTAEGTAEVTTPVSEPQPSSTSPTSSSTPTTEESTEPENPCEPIGDLDERELNDRCVDAAGELVTIQDTAMADPDPKYGTERWALECADDAPAVAVRNQLLVAVAPGGDLGVAVEALRGAFDASPIGEPIGSHAQLVEFPLPPETTLEEAARRVQEFRNSDGEPREFVVGFNWVEHVQPNDAFRPYDDPVQVEGDPIEWGEEHDGPRVLVLDSTSNVAEYDLDGNGLVDEDHGHGEFVASIVQSYAPDANVWLEPVVTTEQRLPAPSNRWVPMGFSDSDVLAAFVTATSERGPFDFVNLSLGGVGCAPDLLDGRIALARALRSEVAATDVPTQFVAAAGNQSQYVLHFPAAWRSPAVIDSLVALGALTEDEGKDFTEFFADHLHAVGSADANGDRSTDFSNCGDWIDMVANGVKQEGNYPVEIEHPSGGGEPVVTMGRAAWSGTSFATAVVTGQLANGDTPLTPSATYDNC